LHAPGAHALTRGTQQGASQCTLRRIHDLEVYARTADPQNPLPHPLPACNRFQRLLKSTFHHSQPAQPAPTPRTTLPAEDRRHISFPCCSRVLSCSSFAPADTVVGPHPSPNLNVGSCPAASMFLYSCRRCGIGVGGQQPPSVRWLQSMQSGQSRRCAG
jgi:hypothetical protein